MKVPRISRIDVFHDAESEAQPVTALTLHERFGHLMQIERGPFALVANFEEPATSSFRSAARSPAACRA